MGVIGEKRPIGRFIHTGNLNFQTPENKKTYTRFILRELFDVNVRARIFRRDLENKSKIKPNQPMKHTLILAALFSSISLVSAEPAKQTPVTAEQQKAYTPDQVLSELIAGNERFVTGKLSDLNIQANIAASTSGQYPKAVILSCLDSRVPVENVFDQGIGDIFVGRVAGNIETTELLGSFEFATKAAGAKLIMVLGHEACGAVKGACDHVEMGNLTALLDQIQPAVKAVESEFTEDKRNSKNTDYVNRVIEENVKITIADIRKNSPILAEMEKAGTIKIVGGIYSLKDGKVTLLK